MIPDSEEIIKFDREGNAGRTERYIFALKRFLDSRMFFVVLLVLVGVASFELGLLSNIYAQKQPITITEESGAEALQTGPEGKAISPEQSKQGSMAEGGLIASKSGTKYYYPWCGSAARISEKNKIYFASIAEARAKGYTPAANCKGLE